MEKRFLSFLLSFCVILTLMPIPVRAMEVAEMEKSNQTAFDAIAPDAVTWESQSGIIKPGTLQKVADEEPDVEAIKKLVATEAPDETNELSAPDTTESGTVNATSGTDATEEAILLAVQSSNCDVEIHTPNRRVYLYNSPTDSSWTTYFSGAVTAYGEKKATVNGTTWYEITANHKGVETKMWVKVESDFTIVDLAAIGKPTLSVSVNNSTVTFSWAKVSNGDTYDIEIYKGNSTNYYKKIWGQTGTSCSVELTDAGDYWAKIAAVNSKSEGWNFSEPTTFTISDLGAEMASGYGQNLPDGNYMIASALDTSYYLDISGGDTHAQDGSPVTLWGLSGDLPEWDAWSVKYTDGFYRISQKTASVSLDVYGVSRESGSKVNAWSSNNSSAQKWAIKRADSEDGYALAAKCSGYWLTVKDRQVANGAEVIQRIGDGSSSQSWLFIPYKPDQPINQGRYILISAMSDDIELDVSGDSGNIPDGTNVQIWKDTAPSQYNSFDLEPLSNGYYRLIHHASGKALEVAGGTLKVKGNVQVSSKKGGAANQEWAITPNGSGYILRVRSSGWTLDVENGNQNRTAGKINGVNVHQLMYNGSTAQTWKFVPAEYAVSYNANNGTGAPSQQIKYYKSALTLSADKPTRNGYKFLGWSTNQSAKSATYQPGDSYQTDANVTLYAVWQENDNPTPSQVDMGTNFYAFIVNTQTNRYLTNDNVNVSSRSKTGEPNQVWRFEKLSDGSYKIISAREGRVLDVTNTQSAAGSNVQVWDWYGNNGQQWFIYGSEKAYRLKPKCSDCVIDLRDGNAAEGTNIQIYTWHDHFAELYSIQKIGTITITYNPNEGNVSPTSKSVEYNETYGSLPVPTRTNYAFDGWYAAAGTEITSSSIVSLTENHTLYAHWTYVPPALTREKREQKNLPICGGLCDNND